MTFSSSRMEPVMRAASFVPMPNSATLKAFLPSGSSFSRSAAAPAPPEISTAEPFLTLIVMGSWASREPIPDIEPSTTKTPAEAPSTGIMYASPEGRLPKPPGSWMSPVEAIALMPSIGSVISVPAAVVTRRSFPAVSISVARFVRSAIA